MNAWKEFFSTYPGDKNRNKTLDAGETAAELSSPDDNAIKWLVEAHKRNSHDYINEDSFCIIDRGLPKENGWKLVTRSVYQKNINDYLASIKSGDIIEPNQIAEFFTNISIGAKGEEDFIGLNSVTIPDTFCAIRKKKMETPSR